MLERSLGVVIIIELVLSEGMPKLIPQELPFAQYNTSAVRVIVLSNGGGRADSIKCRR